MTTRTVVRNEGPGLVIVKLMYEAGKASPNTAPKPVDYIIEERYLAAQSEREFTVAQFQYLLVEEVHP